MRTDTTTRFRLGERRIDPSAGEVDGVRIDARAMEVLVALVEAAPNVLSVAHLLERVWPNVVVVDNVVHQAIAQLRKVLGDEARSPRYIQTIPRRGYRLIAAVGREDVGDGAQVTAADRPALDRSIAVLRPSILGDDSEASALVDVLTEALRMTVAGYQELNLISVPDSIDLHDVHAASYVLHGNVERIDDRIVLRTHLTRMDRRHTVWAKTFDHRVTDALADPSRIAAIVTRFVRTQLVHDQQCESVRRTTRSEEAAAAYRAALAEMPRLAPSEIGVVLSRAQRAVDLDPGIADAHYLVGLCYFFLGSLGRMDWRDAVCKGRAALGLGLASAPDDGQLLALQGRIEQLELNYPAAESSFHASLGRDPLHPWAHLSYQRLGTLALAQGHLDEALAYQRRALGLFDSNVTQYAAYAEVLWYAGRFREAIHIADSGLPLAENGWERLRLLRIKFEAHDALGDKIEAEKALDDALRSVGRTPALTDLLARAGRTDEAQRVLAALEARPHPSVAVLVTAYTGLGDDRAFEWIHKGIDRHIDPVVSLLRVSPIYSGLRNKPRWAEVMAHLEAEEAMGRALHQTSN